MTERKRVITREQVQEANAAHVQPVGMESGSVGIPASRENVA